MRITEKMLLDNYEGITNGGDKISNINGHQIFWDYRTGDQGDGYNAVCSRSNASEITLEYNRVGQIPLMVTCANHPTQAKITHDEATLWGVEV